MIKLNPCANCGRVPVVRFSGMLYCVFGHYNSMYCSNCGYGGISNVVKQTKDDAIAAWNAANPKESKLDDTQAV